MTGYYYQFIYDHKSVDGKFVADFFREVAKTFVPKRRFGDDGDVNDETISEIQQMDFGKSLLIYDSDDAYFNVSTGIQNTIEPRRLFTTIQFSGKKSPLSDEELGFFLNVKSLKIAFECDTAYHFRQTTDNPSKYSGLRLDHSHLRKYYHKFWKSDIIDVSKNPGREVWLPGIIFVAAFKIWFGTEAAALLGKDKIMNFPDAVAVRAYNPDVIEMQLFNKIDQSDDKESVRRQWSIRKYFNLEKLEIPRYPKGGK